MFVYGIRYIDDIVLRVRDANASGPPEERRYYLTDANYNVVMRTDDSGRGVERMFYSAYGQPECFPFGDVDGDYVVDAEDGTALATTISSGNASSKLMAVPNNQPGETIPDNPTVEPKPAVPPTPMWMP